MGDRVRETISELLDRHGYSMKAASVAIGRAHSYMHQYLTRGSPIELRESDRIKLAQYLGIQPNELVPSLKLYELHEIPSPLETMGISSAGIWRDTSLGLPTMKGSPIAGADTRFPADKQYLIKIEGNSIDKLAGDGSYAHSVDFDATGRQIQDLDIVLAERAKPDGTVETTIKRVKLVGGVRELWPESTDPAYQPFFDNADLDIMVQVKGLVLSFHGPKLW